MKVRLIAMTDAVFEGELAGGVESAEQVCNYAAKTCTRKDAGDMLDRHYIGDKPCLLWEDVDLKPLKSAVASGHESILEHAVYTFEVKGVSRALTHQLVRHRIASYSQQSQRYVKMKDFEYIMPSSIKDNTDLLWEGSILDGLNNNTVEWECKLLMDQIYRMYSRLIEVGIPEEDARYILPNATCTNIIVTMNARELLHFFSLRCCERAQWEIRALANRMLRICKEVSPTIFANAGPTCVREEVCRERRSCGRLSKSDMEAANDP